MESPSPWKAAFAFHKDGTPEAEAWVSERLLHVLRGKSSDVAAGIRRSATLRELCLFVESWADEFVMRHGAMEAGGRVRGSA